MSDRGMKKWNAYRSLVEHTETIAGLQSKSEKIEKPELSSDEEEKINSILVHYHGQPVQISYYRDERIYKINTTIKRIDINERKLICEDRQIIYLFELIDIENI